MDPIRVGKFIAEKRVSRGLTQRDVARILNVSDKAVSKWECGRGLPDIGLLNDLSAILNVQISEILAGEELVDETTKLKNKDAEIVDEINNILNLKKKSKWLIITSSIILFITGLLLLGFILKDDYVFNSIVSDSDFFSINGVIILTEKRQSIYISEISYNNDNEEAYLYLECSLVEKMDGNLKEIGTYNTTKGDLKNFNELLKEVEFIIGEYTSMCKDLDDYYVYIDIKGFDEDGKVENYQIPLKLVDDCT